MKCATQINALREAIQAGSFNSGDIVGTEFAFSQQWGLARNTVRRGVNQLVEEGLLERRPGKGLFVRSPDAPTRVVQVVVPSLAWHHCVEIARGAQAAGHRRNIQLQVYNAQGQMALDLEVLRRLPESHADGAIIVSLHHRRFSEVLYELKAVGYPFVVVDQRLYDLEVPTVEIDNYGGAQLVGRKLLELGHERIAFVGPLNVPAVVERFNGLRDVLHEAGVALDSSLVMHIEGEGLDYLLQEQVLELHEEGLMRLVQAGGPTAIFDGMGDLAQHVYRVAKRAGLQIPDDVSVVTFEDAPLTRVLDPDVARVSHPWFSMGELALEILLDHQIKPKPQNASRPVAHQVMTATWIAGASLTRPVPSET